MKKITLTGLSDKAKYLFKDDYSELSNAIGEEIELTAKQSSIDGSLLFKMPDGKYCHYSFLIVEITEN